MQHLYRPPTWHPRPPRRWSPPASRVSSVVLGPFGTSGTPWTAGTAVVYTWYQGGRIGVAPTSTTHGSGTTAADGTLTITGLPYGAGMGLVAKQVTDATDDEVGYHASMVV